MDQSRLNQVFRLANLAVLPGWLLMIFAPNSRWTRRVTESDGFFLGMGGLYAALLARAAKDNPAAMAELASPTLEGIGGLFRRPEGVFAGWVHYLAFDLMIGRTILRDAQERAIPHALVVPALVLTLFTGPLGLAYYRLLVRLRGGR